MLTIPEHHLMSPWVRFFVEVHTSFVKLKHHSDLPNHGVDRKISEVMISTKAEYNLD
jgi:hypothetical protein